MAITSNIYWLFMKHLVRNFSYHKSKKETFRENKNSNRNFTRKILKILFIYFGNFWSSDLQNWVSSEFSREDRLEVYSKSLRVDDSVLSSRKSSKITCQRFIFLFSDRNWDWIEIFISWNTRRAKKSHMKSDNIKIIAEIDRRPTRAHRKRPKYEKVRPWVYKNDDFIIRARPIKTLIFLSNTVCFEIYIYTIYVKYNTLMKFNFSLKIDNSVILKIGSSLTTKRPIIIQIELWLSLLNTETIELWEKYFYINMQYAMRIS